MRRTTKSVPGRKHHARIALACAIVATLVVGEVARAVLVINAAPGFNITWDGNEGDHFSAASPAPVPPNLASAPDGASFASSELGLGIHVVPALNDGLYGNANSWIGGNGDPAVHGGVALGGERQVTHVAWGRDNGNNATDCCGGQLTDRSLGVYTLQVTTHPAPQVAPGAAWTTVGTLDYQSVDDAVIGGGFTPWFRHQYAVSTAGGDPLTATGVRILPPGTGISPAGTAIDEIEVIGTSAPGAPTPIDATSPSAHLRGDLGVNTLAGNVIRWNDQSGNGNHAAPGVAPSLVADGVGGLPSVRLDAGIEHVNLPGAGALGLQSSDYEIFVVARSADANIQFLTASGFAAGVAHHELHLNGAAGARFIPAGFVNDASAADIGVPGAFTDGQTQVYSVRVEGNTGIIRVNGAQSADTVAGAQSPVDTGFLTLGVRGNASFPLRGDIAEVLVYDQPLSAAQRRNVERHLVHKHNGVYLEETGGDGVSYNVASQENGGVAFAQDVIPGFPAIHAIDHLNDGEYGNSNSWIGLNTGAPSFAGVAFEQPFKIDRIAFGRDNGGEATVFTDRVAGVYTLQYTTDEVLVDAMGLLINNPQWFDIADLTYSATGPTAFPNDPFLRHEWSFNPISGVTGVRIGVSNNFIAIDEIEVNAIVPEPATAALLAVATTCLIARRRRTPLAA